MKYEAPELKAIELDTVDVIQTSGGTGSDRDPNELPGLPIRPPVQPTSMDEQF